MTTPNINPTIVQKEEFKSALNNLEQSYHKIIKNVDDFLLGRTQTKRVDLFWKKTGIYFENGEVLDSSDDFACYYALIDRTAFDPLVKSLNDSQQNFVADLTALSQLDDSWTSKITELKEKVIKKSEELVNYKSTTESRATAHQNTLTKLRDEMQEMENSYERDLADRKWTINSKLQLINELYQEIDQLHETITQLEAKLTPLPDEELDELSLPELKERYQEVFQSKQCQDLIRQREQRQFALFQERLATQREDLATKIDEINELKQRFEQEKKLFENQVLAQKAIELDLLHRQIIEFKLERQELKQEHQTALANFEQRIVRERDSLQSKLTQTEENLSSLREQQLARELNIKTLEQEITKLNQELDLQLKNVNSLKKSRKVALIGSSIAGWIDYLPDKPFSIIDLTPIKNPIKTGIATVSSLEIFRDTSKTELLYESTLLGFGALATVIIPFGYRVAKLIAKRISKATIAFFGGDSELSDTPSINPSVEESSAKSVPVDVTPPIQPKVSRSVKLSSYASSRPRQGGKFTKQS